MQKLSSRLTYANTMSTIAVFLSLAGATAFAATTLKRNSVGARQLKKNAVTGVKVKNGSLTGADVNASTLGKVPAAQSADSAAVAASIAPPEAVHVVGAAGEPALDTQWSASSIRFYLDRAGFVHLEGEAFNGDNTAGTIFTLPAGLRPKKAMSFPVLASSGAEPALTEIAVNADGRVIGNKPLGTTNGLLLSNITWRAEQ